MRGTDFKDNILDWSLKKKKITQILKKEKKERTNWVNFGKNKTKPLNI